MNIRTRPANEPGRSRRKAVTALVAGLAAAASLPGTPAWSTSAGPDTGVVVREAPCAGDAPERAVERAGGTVVRQLGIIGGFAARVPSAAIASLRAMACVEAVTEDAPLQLHSTTESSEAEPGSMVEAIRLIGADEAHGEGVTGTGVDVALIDSGVTPVPGLAGVGKVRFGPDLSFESQDEERRHLDGFGHGTHMAGIIAGSDSGSSKADDDEDDDENGDESEDGSFSGIAPGARVVSVKVASSNGATDVSQVIAAIDWVVQHRNREGLNIRVLNLSFGTQSDQHYTLDPLAFAAEVAWRKGIVVVAAAGNDGNNSGRLTNPAYNPTLLAVGAHDGRGTRSFDDDEVPEFSSRGDGARNPDVVAPGRSIRSLRVPGSTADVQNPGARAGDRFIKGSGSSQAAAMTSGAAALLLSQRPKLTPDQVKALLTSTARRLPHADPRAQGAGLVDVEKAMETRVPAGSTQSFPHAKGTGSLERARGGAHVLDSRGVALRGEQDIFGKAFSAESWARRAADGAGWDGGGWNGTTWTGMTWKGMTWKGMTWSGEAWAGMKWSGMTWSGMKWSGMTWSGMKWSGMTWSGMTWG